MSKFVEMSPGTGPRPTKPERPAWQIRRAAAADAPALRAVRLAALAESPEAFGSTLERERRRTPEDWHRWLTTSVTFIVWIGAEPKGLVAGVADADPTRVWLMAMWLDPSLRGSGAAEALVGAVLDWAAGAGAAEVRLHVKRQNLRAVRFYGRRGFEPVAGHSHQPDELEMQHRLTPAGSRR